MSLLLALLYTNKKIDIKMKNKIHNRRYLNTYRKKLRNNSTSAEATLWKSLQKKQLRGRKFRRQHSINNFIADFYCASEKLIIELDGAVHFNFAQRNYDHERTLQLEKLGFMVIRFENKEVFQNLEIVLETISDSFKK
jgi:very-short-patch-repair endonuclease